MRQTDANWTESWTTPGHPARWQYTITGLTNGTEYDLQVRAVNSNGDGTWSDN